MRGSGGGGGGCQTPITQNPNQKGQLGLQEGRSGDPEALS